MADIARATDVAIPKTPDALRALIARAQKGDESARPVVRKMLEGPAAVDLFGGNLADLALQSFIDAMGGDNIGFKEAVRKKLELIRTDLLGDNPTPVERLLVGRVVACWLQVQDADARYAQAQGKLTLPQAAYHLRRMDAAHRRYLAAIRTLAVVRRLAVPVLQINVAEKQVNVAVRGPAAPARQQSGVARP